MGAIQKPVHERDEKHENKASSSQMPQLQIHGYNPRQKRRNNPNKIHAANHKIIRRGEVNANELDSFYS